MIIAAGILIGFVFIVESYVWYVRTMAAPAYRSKSISTSNMVMYITRVLIIGYQIILNFTIESGGGLRSVLIATLIGMVVSLFGHAILFYNKKLLDTSWKFFICTLTRLRIIKAYEYEQVVYSPVRNIGFSYLALASALSTIALVFVYIAPQIFATLYSDYRLTLSSIGQVISFFGMVITLFVLDPALFKMHDAGEIQKGFSLYLQGRIMGLVFAIALLLACLIQFT
jgi:hypothetical protein